MQIELSKILDSTARRNLNAANSMTLRFLPFPGYSKLN